MICGIDEAGRGCLAGSMFIAGVIYDDNNALKSLGVKDSKKLSKKKRYAIASALKQHQHFNYFIVKKTNKDIDSRGLSRCLNEALSEIIEHFSPICNDFIMDGNTCFGVKTPQHIKLSCVVKGDDKLLQISAASIMAKCAKDIEMTQLHNTYPLYDFIHNAGYGTKAHLEAIKEYGITDAHRKSFTLNLCQKTLM